jgi:hypothetical protein
MSETIQPVLAQLLTPRGVRILSSWTSNWGIQNRVHFHLHRFQELAKTQAPPLHEKIRKNIDHAGKVIALEEWRNDGIALNLALKRLDSSSASKVFAALLMKRLGTLSSKMSPSLPIHLDRLLKSGFLSVSDDLRLELKIHSLLDLPRAMEASLNQSMSLNRDPFPQFLGSSMDLAENLIRHLRKKAQKPERNVESVRLESNSTPVPELMFRNQTWS